MLARRLTTILPAMTLAEAIETTRIHRVAGLTGDRTALVTTCPFRTHHQTLSDAGRIGGGHVPRPGDVSLAHHGGLFLDEWPSFAAMSSRSCANRWRRVSYTPNLPGAADLVAWTAIAERLQEAIRETVHSQGLSGRHAALYSGQIYPTCSYLNSEHS